MDNPSFSPHLDGAKPPSNRADSTPIPKDDELHSQRVLAKVDRERTETDSIMSDDAAGVKKAEAVVLAWDKNAVWAVYAWYANQILQLNPPLFRDIVRPSNF
jgi:hypothetical protein